jgi:acyl-CoA thioesterase I
MILGDSLSLKRPWEGINEKNTYAYKLKNFGIILNKSRHANTTFKQLKKIKSDISETKSDVYIIQLGIVDCCPRIFTYNQHRFLSLLNIFFPKLVNFYTNKKSKNRYEKTKKQMIVFTTKSKYKQNMQKIINIILNYNDTQKIFLVNIAYPSNSLKEKNYNIENQIIEYNNILNEFQNERISIIDLFSFTKNNSNSLLGDEHISEKGHNFILDSIKSYLTKFT